MKSMNELVIYQADELTKVEVQRKVVCKEFLQITQSEALHRKLQHNRINHIGASIKDLGKKWFAFTKTEGFASEIISKLKGEGNEGL